MAGAPPRDLVAAGVAVAADDRRRATSVDLRLLAALKDAGAQILLRLVAASDGGKRLAAASKSLTSGRALESRPTRWRSPAAGTRRSG